jgi:CBS domain-containing protein
MAFFSELLNIPITDVDGSRVGVLDDVIARQQSDTKHPVVVAIVLRTQKEKFLISFSDLAVLISSAIPLRIRLDELIPFQPLEGDIFLARDVLDKQIIDTNGARVVRVNDIQLVRVNGSVYISNVDIGGLGLLRRIGLNKIAEKLDKKDNQKPAKNYISWDFVELLLRDQFMRLKVPGEKISDLHPADIAEILSDLKQSESGQILETLDIEQLADALEEVEPEFQASLIKGMTDEKVADVLEEMSPDEAADLLAELPQERSKGLLELMEDEEAADVRRLLEYDEDTAGGLMTTDIVTIRPNLTAAQAIDALRASDIEASSLFYVYVTDHDNHLDGVFSVSDLILAKPKTPVIDLMYKHVVSAKVSDKQEKLAQAVAKYNLMAIPVVDEENHLLGMVTTDDALDKIIPTAWKKRLPRFYYETA